MANPQTTRVAVVGAGISGVLAAGHLLATGLEVTVFERNAAPGGVWYAIPFFVHFLLEELMPGQGYTMNKHRSSHRIRP